MTGPVQLLVSFAAGIALGAVYFGGLWHTVKGLPDSRRPFAYLFWSFVVRASITLTGLYLVTNGRWDQLACALIGVLLSRGFLIRRLGKYAP